jgi:hypothetical protein
MISSNTFHVVSTELVVGSFSLAGVAFLFCLLSPRLPLFFSEKQTASDSVAHAALLFGLAATPFAILSGLSSAPGGEMSSALLANKMLFSLSGAGLALGVLVSRWRNGIEVWSTARSSLIQGLSGAGATGLMLLTASAGGTFARGESLLDWLHLPYNEVLLMPTFLSIGLLLLGIACTAVAFRPSS